MPEGMPEPDSLFTHARSGIRADPSSCGGRLRRAASGRQGGPARPALLGWCLVLVAALGLGPLLQAQEPATAASDAAGSDSPWERWQSGFVTTPDGVRIHYFEAGPTATSEPTEAAPPPSLLFVPGLTLPAQIWAPQVEYFARTHRVVAMDPRSQGRSERTDDGHYPEARGRDVQAVIEALGLAPVVPVCWSLAVAECVALVDQFGTGDLAGLVLVDGLAGGEFNPQVTPLMIAWAGRLMRDRSTLNGGFVRSMYMTPQDPAYLARVEEWSLQTPTDAMVALFLGGVTNDNREVLSRIDRPILFTVARSPFLPAYEEMRDRMPQVRFEIFDAGHALFIDQAEAFNGLVEEWLMELPAAEDLAARVPSDATAPAGPDETAGGKP